jgi:hypothetical protein
MPEGVVRFVALDRKHDRDLGYQITPDDVDPELLGKPVWGVWEQVEDDSEDAASTASRCPAG